MDGTILGQGTFIGTGNNVTIAIPSGADFLNVWNYTQAAASASTYGVQYYWQLGMGSNAIVYSNGTANAATIGVTTGGFNSLVWPSAQGPLNNGSTGISGISSATPPVATVGSTAGMGPGYVVRLSGLVSTGGTNIYGYNGIDWTVGIGTLDSTHFSIDFMNTVTTTSTGNFRVIGFPVASSNAAVGNIVTTDGFFYPRVRTISNISAASSAVIKLTVQHNFSVGQAIRINLVGGSAIWGSYAALDNYNNNGLSSSTSPNFWTITNVNYSTNTITINANTIGFGTFAYPTSGAPFTPPQVVPFGEDDGYLSQTFGTSVASLSDAVTNVAYLGMVLTGGNGTSNPAGGSGDQIFWVAGKSMYGGQ